MKKIIIGIFILIVLAACSPNPVQIAQAIPTPTLRPSVSSWDLANCQPEPYTIPTLPAKIPGYNELDESIGLHITGSYQIVDPKTYRLKVSGKVDNPLELSYDQIRCLPTVTEKLTLICPMVFEDVATWTGVPLKTILDLAGVQDTANDLVLVSADGYQVEVTLPEALQQESFLAYEVNEQILPILHGFPLRAVFPDMPGAKWIKWLVEIQVK
jgi:DMSO/TMAO reductase YedYZ molybdopterin-dependent catalytic subunit